jgi:outer membrane protein assembly factor BamB
VLQAFDANDITKLLWSSDQDASKNAVGKYAKFATPTIADGHVYLATFSNAVQVYGLK